jgi:hypothetical protein
MIIGRTSHRSSVQVGVAPIHVANWCRENPLNSHGSTEQRGVRVVPAPATAIEFPRHTRVPHRARTGAPWTGYPPAKVVYGITCPPAPTPSPAQIPTSGGHWSIESRTYAIAPSTKTTAQLRTRPRPETSPPSGTWPSIPRATAHVNIATPAGTTPTTTPAFWTKWTKV